MTFNHNSWVKKLLSWHGHDRGGVHVPFQPRDKPLSTVIVTGVVQRLRSLARALAQGDPAAPRWIFLIGGPGNGKSETVEDFLIVLDRELGMGGGLERFLQTAFSPNPLVPRRVDVNASDMAAVPGQFGVRVDRLIVVQDATATDAAMGNAAKELADDIADLVTFPDAGRPLFLACVNRGLLTRSLREAVRDWGADNDATKLITGLLRASSLGREALTSNRLACWPLDGLSHVACWPMDLESLLERTGTTSSPVEQILVSSTDVANWDVSGSCADCDANALCPFRQNAEWIRDPAQLDALRTILRRGELSSGQRWNFRDTFSLAANLLVGDWCDFDREDHPCTWIHNLVRALPASQNNDDEDAVVPLRLLVEHLYPHAMFLSQPLLRLAEAYSATVTDWSDQPISKQVVREVAEGGTGPSPSIRQLLVRDYAALDPAVSTPTDVSHPLYRMEMDYNQSVAQGNDQLPLTRIAQAEARFLTLIATAELEWDLTLRNAAEALHVLQFLRRLASIVAKRSMGTRLGRHAEENLLCDFEATLRDTAKLGALKTDLQHLLGEGGFQFDVVESFGQPRGDGGGIMTIQTGNLPLRVIPAPVPTATTPAHDVPCFEIRTGSSEYRMPITFAFFRALRLRSAGCLNSSLPSSVRASIDRVRHLYAGELCRRADRVVDGTVEIAVGDSQKIHLDHELSPPSLVPRT